MWAAYILPSRVHCAMMSCLSASAFSLRIYQSTGEDEVCQPKVSSFLIGCLEPPFGHALDNFFRLTTNDRLGKRKV
jgi:hypothetical protein